MKSLHNLRSKQQLKQAAIAKTNNERLLAYVSGTEWENITALELHYHISCYRNLTRPLKRSKNLNNENVFKEVYQYVSEKIITNFEVLKMSDVWNLYSSCNLGSKKPITKQSLLDYLMKRFNPDIYYWTPKYGEIFLLIHKSKKEE
jgi:hypothetical protein